MEKSVTSLVVVAAVFALPLQICASNPEKASLFARPQHWAEALAPKVAETPELVSR